MNGSFLPKPSPLTTKETRKTKELRNLHLQHGNKVVLTSGTCRNIILQYLPLQSITAFLPVLDSCGFIPNDNKGFFVQTLIQLLIGIPTNAAQPPAVAAGVT